MAVVLDIALDVSPAQLEALNGAVVAYIRDRPMAWRSGIIEFYVYSIHPERNSMTVAFWLKHRLPYQQCVTVFADVGSFLLFIASTLRSLHVDYRMPKQPIEIVGGEGGHLSGQRWAPDAPDSSNGMGGPAPIASLLNGSGGAAGGGLLRPSGTPPLHMPQQPPPHIVTAPLGLPWVSQGMAAGVTPTQTMSVGAPEPVRLHQPNTGFVPQSQPQMAMQCPVPHGYANPYLTAYGQQPQGAMYAPPSGALPPFPHLQSIPGQPGATLPAPMQHPAQLVAAEQATRQWRDIRTGSIAHLWRPEQRFFVPVVSSGVPSMSAGVSGEGGTSVPAPGMVNPGLPGQYLPGHESVMWSSSWPLQVQMAPGVFGGAMPYAGTVVPPAAMFGPLPSHPQVAHSAPVGGASGLTKSASATSLGSEGRGSASERMVHLEGTEQPGISKNRNISDPDLRSRGLRSGGSGSVTREVTAGPAPQAAAGKHRRIELTHTVDNFGGIQLKPQTERQRQQQDKVKARLRALGMAAKPGKGKKAAAVGDTASVGEGGSLGRGDSICGRSRSWGKDSLPAPGAGKPRNKSVLWALRQGEAWERGSIGAAPERAVRSASLNSQSMAVSRSTDNLAQLAAGTLSPDDQDDSKSN